MLEKFNSYLEQYDKNNQPTNQKKKKTRKKHASQKDWNWVKLALMKKTHKKKLHNFSKHLCLFFYIEIEFENIKQHANIILLRNLMVTSKSKYTHVRQPVNGLSFSSSVLKAKAMWASSHADTKKMNINMTRIGTTVMVIKATFENRKTREKMY